MTQTRRAIVIGLLMVLALAGCSLSSEPEIVQQIALPTPVPQITVPGVAPDLAAGAAFFADHCVECHGEGGRGDGQMVVDGNLKVPPPDFSLLETTTDKTPQDYMRAVTEGNLVALMPPFARYSEAERWNVAAYVYSGTWTDEQFSLGAAVYEANCATCHGAEGTGDGPDAAEIMPDLTDLATWAQSTNQDVLQAVSEGVAAGMPAFAGDLSEDEQWAVVGYARSLALNGTPGFGAAEVQAAVEPVVEEGGQEGSAETVETAPDPTAEPAAEMSVPETITVSGTVTNGTPGGTVPADLPLTLHMFDPPTYAETTIESALGEGGTYLFEEVPFVEGRVYLLSLRSDEVYFSSSVYQVEDFNNPTLETSIELFDITSDPSAIKITSGVMRVNFSDFGMEVAEVLSVSNTTDMLYLTDERLSENQRVALEFALPPGAVGVGFEAGQQGSRFFTNDEGTAIIDTQPVRPGGQQIFYSYMIPYDDGAIIEQPVSYTYDGQFHLLLEADQVAVEAEIFDGDGERVDMGGTPFDAFIANVVLEPGDVLSFTLSGKPNVQSADSAAAPAGDGALSPVVLVMVVAGLMLVGAGGFMFLLKQDAGEVDELQEEIDDLLEQIAELDDKFAQGKLKENFYKRTRKSLKSQLADLMRQREQSGDDE